MRTFLRSFAVAAALICAAGPAWAAAPAMTPTLTIGAPQAPADVSPGLEDLLYLGPVAFGITIRRNAGDIANKFATRAGAAVNDYKAGVEGAGNAWQARTLESESAYEQGVTESIGRKAFGAGVSKAGAAKYQRNASILGPGRFQQGVSNAKDAYATAIAPVLAVLSGLQLGVKGPRGSQANFARSNAVGLALRNWKTGKS